MVVDSPIVLSGSRLRWLSTQAVHPQVLGGRFLPPSDPLLSIHLHAQTDSLREYPPDHLDLDDIASFNHFVRIPFQICLDSTEMCTRPS